MESAPLVTLWPALRVSMLAGAELAEVLGGLGDDVGEELHFDAAQWLATQRYVEECHGVA